MRAMLARPSHLKLRSLPALVAALACLPACGGESDAGGDADAPAGGAQSPDKTDRAGGPGGAEPSTIPRDIVTTDLVLDLTARRGRATLGLARGTGPARFEVGDLRIEAVSDEAGEPLNFTRPADGVVEVAARTSASRLTFDYGFSKHAKFDGWDATPGFTFLWPYYCGNLFPCHSGPDDGTKFTLEVAGVPAGKQAVYPRSIPAAAPSYQIGLAVGEYTYDRLGETPAGTEVGLYTQPGGRETGLRGAAHLPGYFAFFEKTLGPYLFGEAVASVSVDWGPGDFGGLEHHPLWHIDDGQMGDANTHAHEAAHGWYGDGVRIACWEDFVLSEGTVTYLAARAIEAVEGPEAGAAQWALYTEDFKGMAAAGEDTVAWLPDTCNAIRIADHPLWSLAIYYRGAFFLRAIEGEIGREALDGVLSAFYRTHGGKKAARMQDLLDALETRTDVDPTVLADLSAVWLLGTTVPDGF